MGVWLTKRLTIWLLLAVLVLTAAVLVILFLVALVLPVDPVENPALVEITSIAALPPTPRVETPSGVSTLRPTALSSTPSPAPGEIRPGIYVQITDTGGAGLRLRSSPSLSGQPVFLGMDSELFEVKDGPKDADGFTWWFLQAPYDAKRSGWAAAKYLTVVTAPVIR